MKEIKIGSNQYELSNERQNSLSYETQALLPILIMVFRSE